MMNELRQKVMHATSAFLIDPSAANWTKLANAMEAYQNARYPSP